MSYQVLARKWRPQDFAALIGQAPIVTALSNALREGRIAQAYLFSGIRGVGKTTAARVLAKALNCEHGPTPEPCNRCTPCREISAGSDLDVLEVDAATYSKVEQVRELTESLRYGPARDRYKVVVLDEVHRLSRQAFDALLKIVEEPPPHVVFIFATTEIDAVPATILSRCQEYHFRRVAVEDLVVHLREICTAETIAASDAALRLIARAGEGSVRDSVALLDQLATFGGGTVADGDAARLAGGLDNSLFLALLGAMLAGNAAAVSAAAREVEDHGFDPRSVHAHFLAFCRDALHLALGSPLESATDLPREDAAALAALVRGAGYENLLRLLHQLLASESLIRRSESGALALEIAWLRGAELPKLRSVEEILRGGAPLLSTATSPAPAPAPPSRPAPAARPAAAAPKSAAPPPTAVAPARPLAEPAAVPAAPPTATDPALQPFLEAVSRRKQSLAAHLAQARRLEWVEGELRIHAPAGDTWLGAALERPSNRQVLEEALHEVWGAAAGWRLCANIPANSSPAAPETAPTQRPVAPPEEPAALNHPTVQNVLELFNGRVESVQRRTGEGED